LFAWYDFWVGAYWSRKDRRLYVLPLPMVGFVLDFGPEFKSPAEALAVLIKLEKRERRSAPPPSEATGNE
jgi:hypothetical protein